MALPPPSPSGLRAPPLPLSRSSALLAHTERAITASPLLPLNPSKTTIKHLLRGPPWITWRSRESSLKSCSHRFSSLAERLRIVSSLGPSPMDKRCRLGRYGALSLSRHRWYGYGEARKRVQTARARCTAGGKQATLHTQVRGIFPRSLFSLAGTLFTNCGFAIHVNNGPLQTLFLDPSFNAKSCVGSRDVDKDGVSSSDVSSRRHPGLAAGWTVRLGEPGSRLTFGAVVVGEGGKKPTRGERFSNGTC
ncbi:hypothetical protein CSPX01_10355 [Colletotrichum filicis]|nr:hypothetical protein CSPX01_10355 [Colletotrichum filicis]